MLLTDYLEGITHATRHNSAIENRHGGTNDAVNARCFKNECENCASHCGNRELNCRELYRVAMGRKAVTTKDVSAKEDGAKENERVARGERKVFFNAKKVHAHYSERNREPNGLAGFLFE